MDKYESIKLKNQLCFPLYAAAKEVVKKYTPHLKELGLTYTQYIALMVLWEKDGISVKNLGEILYLDSGTLTPLLKSLEEKGFITRKRDTRDERAVCVRLTEYGVSAKDKAVEIPEKVAGCIGLSPEEGKVLYTLLYKILG